MISEKALDELLHASENIITFINGLTFSGYDGAVKVKSAYESAAAIHQIVSCEKEIVKSEATATASE